MDAMPSSEGFRKLKTAVEMGCEELLPANGGSSSWVVDMIWAHERRISQLDPALNTDRLNLRINAISHRMKRYEYHEEDLWRAKAIQKDNKRRIEALESELDNLRSNLAIVHGILNEPKPKGRSINIFKRLLSIGR